jgi:hypothetical protein
MANANEVFERFFREAVQDKLIALLKVRGDVIDLIEAGADIRVVFNHRYEWADTREPMHELDLCFDYQAWAWGKDTLAGDIDAGIVEYVDQVEKRRAEAKKKKEEEETAPLMALELKHINLQGVRIKLVEPLILEVSQDDTFGYWVWNERFKLHAYGKVLGAAVDELNMEFNVLWEEYVEADPEELTDDAIVLVADFVDFIDGGEIE